MNNLFKGNGSRSPMQIWDILSIIVLILTACIVGYFVLIYFNEDSKLNILPPSGGLLSPKIPTATPAPATLVPTWTASPTLEMTATRTPVPTWTPLFTDTPFSLVPPTRTPKPTNTPKALFGVTVKAIPSTIFYPELACSYFGVGGEAVDVKNGPYKFGIIKVGGTLNGQTIDPTKYTTVTGVATKFGQAGFEIVFAMPPTNSNKTLWIQMFDVSDIPQSDRIYFNTYSDCEKNLIQVRFKATR
ncbi:MAG: hypothetical protein IPP66_10175 [Anaerolineales bacterium]|nr:hypothetical protein [Anaerolineales bacterium]